MQRIRHWLFDLDDTLYPADAGLFPLVSRRITERIAAHLGLPLEEARALQRRYWREYGTSLRGMIVRHGLDPEPFLAYVHDVPVEDVLAPDPALAAVLARLPGRCHVFTNGPAEFVRRVLRALELEDSFERIFDIRHAGFVPKPNVEPYERVLAAIGEPGTAFVLVDDSPQNLEPARARGMTTVWLRSPTSVVGGSAGNTVALAEAARHADVTIDRLADLEAGVRAYLSGRG